jgi:hypothetical protein
VLLISDLSQTLWQQDPVTGRKQRVVSYTMPLSQSLGPKTTQVTENHVSSVWNSDFYGRDIIFFVWDILTSWACGWWHYVMLQVETFFEEHTTFIIRIEGG